MQDLAPQRLQKILANLGFGSRRDIEALIVAGKIFVNGKRAVLGLKVSSQDQIVVDGVNIKQATTTRPRIILYNKPLGEICTRHDPQGRNTVFTSLPKLTKQRWVGVGRLDINSSGLILFTTEGELANRLMHPKYAIEREYAVRVLGTVTPQIVRNITQGVTLHDGAIGKFSKVEFKGGKGANLWYHVALKQGRYREVREIWKTQGITVNRLIRVRFGTIFLPKDLPEGQWMELDFETFCKKLNI